METTAKKTAPPKWKLTTFTPRRCGPHEAIDFMRCDVCYDVIPRGTKRWTRGRGIRERNVCLKCGEKGTTK